MKLITQQLKERFAQIGNQEEASDPIIVAKFFNPCGRGTWYAISYDPTTSICFGYVTGLGYDELGDFSVTELESINLPLGLTIERDIHFKECRLSEVKSGKVQ